MSSPSKPDTFALVPCPPEALAKAEPSAKRILSGMVADTLALAKKEQALPVVSVAMCGWAEACFQEIVEMVLRQGLATQSRIEFKFFFWTTDFLEAARYSRFDLFILWLNPGSYARKETANGPPRGEPNWGDHGDEVNAYELIAGLKREFNRPVIAVSNCLKYESKSELEKAGADAVFWMPFGLVEFLSALQSCLKLPSPDAVAKKEPQIKTVISVLVAGGVVDSHAELFEVALRTWLSDQCDLELVAADNAVEVLRLAEERHFDLFIVLLNQVWAGLDEIELDAPDGGTWGDRISFLTRLKKQFGKPIIAMSGLGEIGFAERAQRAGADAFFQMPFDFENFRDAVQSCLGIPTG